MSDRLKTSVNFKTNCYRAYYSRIPNFQCRDYGDNLAEKRHRDEDDHGDEKTAVFLIGDKESVDADAEGEETKSDHEVGSEREPDAPEA